jgi:pimeloyl-ACP methyl ester carboxylesterase
MATATPMMAKANGIEICYETFGNPKDPPVLLIAMYSQQMLVWPETLCEGLAARGFYIIRFDHRDIGLSTKFEEAGLPDLLQIVSIPVAERVGLVAYTLEDMAKDAVGLLDALDLDKAHIVGASMGGMIAQIVAGQYPDRTKSLVSIMSTPDVAKSPPLPEAMGVVGGGGASDDAEAKIQAGMAGWRAIGTEAFGPSDEELRSFVVRNGERSSYPAGPARHIAAIQASPGREEMLARLKMPCLVIHGTEDPLVPLIGGELTAKAVPGAELVAIEGMGHELFSPTAPLVEELVGDHLEKAEGR